MYAELCDKCFQELLKDEKYNVQLHKNKHYCIVCSTGTWDDVALSDVECEGVRCHAMVCPSMLRCVTFTKKEKYIKTKFHKLIESCKNEADLIDIELAIDKNKKIVNTTNKKGLSPLTFTCMLPTSKIRYKIIQLLIDEGANVQDVDIQLINNRSVIKKLLENGYQVGEMIFDCIKDDLLKVILPFMKDINLRWDDYNLIMFHIAECSPIHTIQVLIEAGLDLNIINERKETVLSLLWRSTNNLDEFNEIFNCLLKSGRFDLDKNLQGVFVHKQGLSIIESLCTMKKFDLRMTLIKKILDGVGDIEKVNGITIFYNITKSIYMTDDEKKELIDYYVEKPHDRKMMINSLKDEYVEYYFERYFVRIAMKKVLGYLGLQQEGMFVPREIAMDIFEKI